MKRIHLLVGALGLIAFLPVFLFSCSSTSTPILDEAGSGANAGGGDVVVPSGDPDSSVGEVSDPSGGDVGEDGAGRAVVAVRARVRNESSARADVTLRFIRESTVVHLAFVRVLPGTITTVSSPESAEEVELSGVDENGRALQSKVYRYGVDFDDRLPAEYVVVDDVVSPEEPRPTPVEESPTVVPSHVTMIQPAEALTVALGETFEARWTDEAGSPSALVTVYLQPAELRGEAGLVVMGPAVGALLDGINDALVVVVQNVAEGLYRVVAKVGEGEAVSVSVAPGRIRVIRDPEDIAPTLGLRSPQGLVALGRSEGLTVAWVDADPDDNATITFELTSVDTGDGAVQRFSVGPPIAENPDGPTADQATLPLGGVLPGFYDLTGTIDDGRLIGTSRLERVLRVLPDAENDPARLTLLQPSSDMQVEVGRALLVRWEDDDANDDARISLLLDPDLGNSPLDGDEVLLAASLGENADGVGDRITLGIPAETALGRYRVVGVISDGLTESMTQAPGLVRILAAAPTAGGNDNGNDNTNDNENQNDNSNDNGSGGVIEIPPPLPVPEPPPPFTVTPLEPAPEDVTVLAGEPVTVQMGPELTTTVRESVRIFLSNIAYGGTTRVDATPVGFEFDGKDIRTESIPVRTEAVPNRAWPRKFDIEIEKYVNDEVEITVGSRPLWILQQVEVYEVSIEGSTCVPNQGTGLMPGSVELRLEWYGGGVSEIGPQPVVHLWLVRDGAAAPHGVEDATHRLVAEVAASPRFMQTLLIDVVSVWNNGAAVGTAVPSQLTDVLPPLDVGPYRLAAVLDPQGAHPTLSGPFVQSVPVCDPSRQGPGR